MTEFKKTVMRVAKKVAYPGAVICIVVAPVANASEVGILGGDDVGIGFEIDKDDCKIEAVYPPEHYYEPHPHMHTSGTITTTTIFGAPATYELIKATRVY